MSHKGKKQDTKNICVGNTVRFQRQQAYVEDFCVINQEVYVIVSPPFVWQGKIQPQVKLYDVELVKTVDEALVSEPVEI